MGYYHHQPTMASLTEHIKIMEDDELLDFWEESQFVEEMSREHFVGPMLSASSYEHIILQELQLRFCNTSHAENKSNFPIKTMTSAQVVWKHPENLF